MKSINEMNEQELAQQITQLEQECKELDIECAECEFEPGFLGVSEDWVEPSFF